MSFSKTYSGSEPLRVNKWLAQEGVCSRREAEDLIRRGGVEIDGEVLTSLGHKIQAGQTLSLKGSAQRILANQLSIIYNKPTGIVSGTPEDDQIPAVRMLTKQNLSGRAQAIPGRYNKLAPCGRLDMDSRGLLIMSEDGVVAKAIIGPESQLEKEYVVKVIGDVTPNALAKLRHGLELDGKPLKPARVQESRKNQLTFVLTEGRNRQIRRMCDLVGLKVVDLYRRRVGVLELAGLPEGKWRPISAKERAALIAGANAGRGEGVSDTKRTSPKMSKSDRSRPVKTRVDRAGKPSGKAVDKPRDDKAAARRNLMKPKKRTKLGPRKRSPIK